MGIRFFEGTPSSQQLKYMCSLCLKKAPVCGIVVPTTLMYSGYDINRELCLTLNRAWGLFLAYHLAVFVFLCAARDTVHELSIILATCSSGHMWLSCSGTESYYLPGLEGLLTEAGQRK